MIKILPEQQMQVYARYWGCKYLLTINIEGNPVVQTLRSRFMLDLEPDLENRRDLILVRKIENITDEHVWDLLALLHENEETKRKDEALHYGIKSAIINGFPNAWKWNYWSAVKIYTFLISKGYNMPTFIGFNDVKSTPLDLGMAIDVDELNKTLHPQYRITL